MTEADWAWLAGIIDGEGTIIITYRSRDTGHDWGLVLAVGMTHKETIDRIYEITGCGSMNVRKLDSKWKPVYTIKFASRQALSVIKNVYPFLVTKKSQADIAIQFCSLIEKSGGRKLTYRDNLIRFDLMSDLKAVNGL